MKVVEKKLVDELPERTEGARRATGVFSGEEASARPPATAAPETEVAAKAQRRRFTAQYKQQIVRAADRCTQLGEIGALLRREGLYSSALTNWRGARDRGELEGLAPKPRGPKATAADPRDRKIIEQEREIVRWKHRAERAEAFVEVQKKVAALLGTPLDNERS
jgi:transposase-like protein